MTGDIPDDLADDICLEFCQPDPETLAPFLISDVDLNALSESERIAILRIFDDDLPVVMIRPTFERMKALLDLIGLEMEDISRDIPKFWGVQTSQEFEIYTYVFDDPAPRQIKTMDIAD